MSLINEALKKARREAAWRDAARAGMPLPQPELLEPRGLPRPAVLAGVAALAVLLAVGTFLAGRRSAAPEPQPTAAPDGAVAAAQTPAAAERVAEAVAEPAGPPSTQVAPAAPTPRTSPGSGAAAATPSRVPTPGARPAAAPDPGVRIALRDRSGASAPERALPQAAPAPRSNAAASELPGGARLQLAGIVWSESNPSAMINGRIVGIGERIEGYTVTTIEPRSVELRNGDDAVVLHLD